MSSLTQKIFQLNKVSTETTPPTSGTTIGSSVGVEMPDFILWVKDEPFVFGILSPHPCPKITVNLLRKVAEYCRDKKGYYPRMSMFEWGHLSKYKLQVSTDLSWGYFRLFDIISKPLDINSPTKNAWDVKCEAIRMGTVKDFEEVNVDTLKFLVFLYIQNYLRLHKKFFSRPPTSDDPWPILNNSSSIHPSRSHSGGGGSPRSSAVLKKRSVPELIQAEFVISNLSDIIEFLSLAVPNGNADLDNKRIPLEIVSALSFILGAASINPLDREFKSLEECLMVLPEVTELVDYDRRTNSLNKEKFIFWVKLNLKLNPWGPSSTPVPQEVVECVTGIWEKTKSYELNRVYWNTQLYPKGWYLMSTVDNQVIYLEPEVNHTCLKIHRCNSSFIYVPGVFTSVLIEKCRNCTIFLGAVGKVVRVVDSSNISFVGAGRFFILCDIYKSTFHILTPCQPVICGSKNRRITLSPYNTFYPKLEEHLDMVSLGVNVQKWNKPLELGPNGIPLVKGQVSNHTFMRPDKFTSLVFPYEMEGSTTRNPVELPLSYAKKLNLLESNLQGLIDDVNCRNLSEGQKNELNSIVMIRFQKWLEEKGHLKELKGLRSMQKTIRAGSSIPILDSRKSIETEVAARKASASIGSPSLNNNGVPTTTTMSSKGSGDLPNGSGGTETPSNRTNNAESVASCSSVLNGLSLSSLGSYGGGRGRPGTVSDSEDEVFLYGGDDLCLLDSVFLADGEDADPFTNEDCFDEYEDGNGYFDGSETRGCDSDNGLIYMPMDDGLLWKPIQ